MRPLGGSNLVAHGTAHDLSGGAGIRGIPVLTSHLIGQLIDLYRRIREHEGVMRLCGLSAYNRRVLHTCHLDDRLQSYDDLHEAVLGYSQPQTALNQT